MMELGREMKSDPQIPECCYADYEPSNVRIYEKECGNYVVYYIAREGDPALFLLQEFQYGNIGQLLKF